MSKTNNKLKIFLNMEDVKNPKLEITENKKVTKKRKVRSMSESRYWDNLATHHERFSDYGEDD